MATSTTGRRKRARIGLVSIAFALSGACSSANHGAAGSGAGSGGLSVGPAITGTGAGPASMAATSPMNPGTGGLGAAGSATLGTAGSGGAGAGTGGAMSGAGGQPGSAGAGAMVGVDPSAIELRAIAANTTVGLDWLRVAGATGYRVYWANASGVTVMNGKAIDTAEPSYVHRGLTNGQAYYYRVSALLGSMEGPLSPEASAMPTGEWVLEALGSGDFDDILTGARISRLPIEKRVQVFLLPEGYLSSELNVFHDAATHDSGNNDVDRWIAEVFALDPYSKFKEAFVIWYLPRASAAHLGAGSTAFSVTVSSGSVTDVNAAAAPLWGALDSQGSDAFLFAAGTTQPPNFVAACMLFDPMRGRAGYSGLTTFLRNPSTTGQSIGTAFAMGHAHEFTHAFARVADEYMETMGHAPMGMSETTNVSASNSCDQLPWAHLLEGRGINTTAGLVGAFGAAALGYHSELYCHMNGTHDNGQTFCMSGDQAYSSLTLRTDHLCNYCRELTTFRLLERTGILAGSSSFADWKSMYRTPFFQRFGFFVPPGAIPETLSCNRNMPTPVYQACVP